MTQETLILGGGPVGRALAVLLQSCDHRVVFVDDDTRTIKRAADAGLDVYESTLDSVAPTDGLSAQTVVVATPSDSQNLLLSAGAPGAFGADRVIALLNDPSNRPAFADAAIETICVPDALAHTTADRIAETEPSLSDEEPSEVADKERLRE